MSKRRGSGWSLLIVGVAMIAMGIHMLSHDDPGYWVPFDIISVGLGVFDIAIGYAIITTGEK